ncbi:MAG: hypothetical protein ACI9EF_000011 [Pseudohongiellaceae bacterium]|jgi:hypothetical protein
MTDKNRPKERRLHRRMVIQGNVELGIDAAGLGKLTDISQSGVACMASTAFAEMTVLEIKMSLPSSQGDLPFQAGGAVVRSEPRDGGQFMVAIFFTHMDDGSRENLDVFLGEQSTDGQPADPTA